jgi:hypothetical protein
VGSPLPLKQSFRLVELRLQDPSVLPAAVRLSLWYQWLRSAGLEHMSLVTRQLPESDQRNRTHVIVLGACTHARTHSLIHFTSHSRTHAPTHLLTHLFTHSLTHLLDLNEVDCQKVSMKGRVRLYISISRPPERSPTAHWVKRAYTHHRHHRLLNASDLSSLSCSGSTSICKTFP